MKRILPALLLLAVVLAGCGGASDGGTSSGPKEPKAVAPVTEHNFGEVLTTAAEKTKEFTIKNEGTADLKITGVQVKLLEGC